MDEHVTLKLLREPCDACPFVGRFDHLDSGRLRSLVDECRADDAVFACHKTIGDDENGSNVVFGPAAVCAGWARIGDMPSVLGYAHESGRITLVEPT